MRSLVTIFTLSCALFGCSSAPPAEEAARQQRGRKHANHAGSLAFCAFKGQEPTRAPGGDMQAPGVTLVTGEGKTVELRSLFGRPLVLVFMRGFAGHVCPYCTTYTAQMAARYAEFQELGAEILVVYPTREEEQHGIRLFVEIVNEILAEEGQDSIPFPVFLDPGAKVVKHYDLAGDLSKPTTFVLDPLGKIQYLYVGRDADDRPALDRVLDEVKKLKQE